MVVVTIGRVSRAEPLLTAFAHAVAAVPSRLYRERLVSRILERDPIALLQAIGPTLNREAALTSTPLDLDPDGELAFEDLAAFFASNSLNHGLIGMTIRQAAYVFGLTRRLGARRAIEIGRWRGGSSILLAAALGPRGELWSIDQGEKETRMFGRKPGSFDEETRRFCERFALHAHLLVGDSRTIEVETGQVDVVLIDGSHAYDVVKSDFERFGRRVRVGGAVLFDDAFAEELFPAYGDDVGRVVAEVTGTPEFELRRRVDRLAHVERISPGPATD